MSQQVGAETVSVTVRNLGGIESDRLGFERGVTVLTGRNATNRTSMLRAIAAGLGGSDASLKVDADEGAVELEIDGEGYRRDYARDNGNVRVTGEPYTENDTLVDTFASLLKSNPVRRAVERGSGEDLRDVVMAPVDTHRIHRRIEEVQGELRTTADRIETIERERERLPVIERRRVSLQDELASVVDELEETREAVDAYEADPDDAEAAEAVIEALRETRADLEAARDELDTQQNAIRALEAERDDVQSELEERSVPDMAIEEIEAELGQLQERERRVEHAINSLLSIIEFNEDLVSGGDGLLDDHSSGPSVPAGLDPESETVECWTCGSAVQRKEIKDQFEDLRELAAERRSERSTLSDRIATLREQRRDYEASVERKEQLERQVESIEREIQQRTGRVEEIEGLVQEHEARIADLEAKAANTEGLRDSDLLDQYQRLSTLEYERGRLERELATVEDDLAELAALEEEHSTLEIQQGELRDELEALRTRIEDLERSMVETFNEQAHTVIELLGYENIERVWIERKAGDSANESAEDSTFELHIVRTAEGGAVLEDTVEHLSESERELVGLTVALAGYLAHDVHESVPLMLLDSLEAIDAERIAALVDYFADYVPYLVVALLPEDAAALDERHQRISMTAQQS